MGRKPAVKPRWHNKQTSETRAVAELLAQAFPNHPPDYPPAAYRFNSASIRVRIVDAAFRRRSQFKRYEMVETVLAQLPEATLTDVMMLVLLAPEEVDESPVNFEFEHPAPSRI